MCWRVSAFIEECELTHRKYFQNIGSSLIMEMSLCKRQLGFNWAVLIWRTHALHRATRILPLKGDPRNSRDVACPRALPAWDGRGDDSQTGSLEF